MSSSKQIPQITRTFFVIVMLGMCLDGVQRVSSVLAQAEHSPTATLVPGFTDTVTPQNTSSRVTITATQGEHPSQTEAVSTLVTSTPSHSQELALSATSTLVHTATKAEEFSQTTTTISSMLTASPSVTTSRSVELQSVPKFLTYPFPQHPDMKVQYGWHGGIDYIKGERDNSSTWENFDVLAAADGYACRFWHEGGNYNLGGWYVRIEHNQNGIYYTTEYNHLDSVNENLIPQCNTVVYVERGQKIGVAGDRNLANYPPPLVHLHFELRVNSTIETASTVQATDPYGIWDINASSYPDPNNGQAGLMGTHYWTTDPPSHWYQNTCDLCCALGSTSANALNWDMETLFVDANPLVPDEITSDPVESFDDVYPSEEVDSVDQLATEDSFSPSINIQANTDPPTSSSYIISRSVFAAGGGSRTSTSYNMQGTSGQSSPVGQRSSASYHLSSGYWSESLASSCTFSGTIDLQSRSDDSGATFTVVGNTTGTFSTVTDTSGYYELAVPEDTYDVTAEMDRYLDGERTGEVCLAGEEIQLPSVTLLGGDTNDDCVINILDLSFMGSRFMTSAGDANYDPRADINADGTVNILDLSVTGGNFMETCPVNWP